MLFVDAVPMRASAARRNLTLLAGGWLALLLVLWAAGEAGRSSLTPTDLNVLESVASARTLALTALAHGLSALASSYVIAALAATLCVALLRAGRRTDAIVIAITVLGASALSTVDKLLVARPRPPLEHLEAVSSTSFPSGHATTSSAFFLAVALLALEGSRRSLRVAVLSATCLLLCAVALSRMYLAVHYPSDVIAGLVLGSCWCLLVRAIFSPGRDREVHAR